MEGVWHVFLDENYWFLGVDRCMDQKELSQKDLLSSPFNRFNVGAKRSGINLQAIC